MEQVMHSWLLRQSIFSSFCFLWCRTSVPSVVMCFSFIQYFTQLQVYLAFKYDQSFFTECSPPCTAYVWNPTEANGEWTASSVLDGLQSNQWVWAGGKSTIGQSRLPHYFLCTVSGIPSHVPTVAWSRSSKIDLQVCKCNVTNLQLWKSLAGIFIYIWYAGSCDTFPIQMQPLGARRCK